MTRIKRICCSHRLHGGVELLGARASRARCRWQISAWRAACFCSGLVATAVAGLGRMLDGGSEDACVCVPTCTFLGYAVGNLGGQMRRISRCHWLTREGKGQGGEYFFCTSSKTLSKSYNLSTNARKKLIGCRYGSRHTNRV